MSKHRLVQIVGLSRASERSLTPQHEGSGRKNLYMAAYIHSFDGISHEESEAIRRELTEQVYKPKYRLSVDWEQPGDMIIWDNTCVMHRATGGSFLGKYNRDMRRTTVKDMSSTKYGLNGEGADWRVGMP